MSKERVRKSAHQAEMEADPGSIQGDVSGFGPKLHQGTQMESNEDAF